MVFNDFDITEFYRQSRGRMVQRILRPLIREWWDNTGGLNVLGYGYTRPYLNIFAKDKPARTVMLMNTHHQPAPWPERGENMLAICDDRLVPLETQRFDRILMIHALETAELPRRLLAEMWRILEGNGRMILVVPNRSGIWSRAEHTPFGQGHPYSLTQLRHSLAQSGFQIERYQRAIYPPPSRSRIIISFAPFIENIARRVCPAFGGVMVVEVSKQLFSPTPLKNNAPRQIPKGAPAALKP